nr:hypothetical protein CFP56_37550 [Quercus suber]
MEAVEVDALAMELQLNELGEIRREMGELGLGLGLEGGITVMKLRKLTQLTHGVRKSAWQRYAREKERLGPLDLAMEAVEVDALAMEVEALAMELQLNELGKIRREMGELSLGLEGGITVMKLRKLTQLTHGVRKCLAEVW